MSKYQYEERNVRATERLDNDLEEVENSLDLFEGMVSRRKDSVQSVVAGHLAPASSADKRGTDGKTAQEALDSGRRAISPAVTKVKNSLGAPLVGKGNGTLLSK